MTSSGGAQVLPHRPHGEDMYIHQTPAWLVAAFRFGMLAASLTAAALSAQDWTTMPIPAKLLAALVGSTLFAFALWPRPWGSLVKFAADAHGLYFPHDSQLVLSFTRAASSEWLFVPWQQIENLRLSVESGGEGGPCVAFDVKVSGPQRAAFFSHVGTPRDRPTPSREVFFASYDDSPPRPSRTLGILVALRGRSEA